MKRCIRKFLGSFFTYATFINPTPDLCRCCHSVHHCCLTASSSFKPWTRPELVLCRCSCTVHRHPGLINLKLKTSWSCWWAPVRMMVLFPMVVFWLTSWKVLECLNKFGLFCHLWVWFKNNIKDLHIFLYYNTELKREKKHRMRKMLKITPNEKNESNLQKPNASVRLMKNSLYKIYKFAWWHLSSFVNKFICSKVWRRMSPVFFNVNLGEMNKLYTFSGKHSNCGT